MKNLISRQASKLRQGEIRAFFNKAKDYDNVISLGIGEPDFTTPSLVIESACKALCEGKTHYTANEGDLTARKAISDYLKLFDLSYNPSGEIIITMGGMGALSTALFTILDPGDEVLIQDPQWLNYVSQVNFMQGIPVRIPVYESEAFSLKAESIEKALTKNSKVLMINSPNNPTGALIANKDLAEIADLAIKNDLLVISDEVYSELIYDGLQYRSIASFPGMKDHSIVINSLSKSFAMTGWRIGYAAGPSEIISKMTILQENLVACAPAAAQAALIDAFSHREEIEPMRNEYRERRDLIVDLVNNIPGLSCLKPQGAFYVFVNISKLNVSSREFAERLLKEYQVVVVPGSAFGDSGEGFIRLSYATKREDLLEAADRMRRFTRQLIEGGS
ncbi:MAG: pyridoxal phosphate-dependent aminotransferase [Anaerolineaceae bacterium]